MGAVYKAFDHVLDRDIAVKTIRYANDATEAEIRDLRDRFLREARTVARSSKHKNIVQIYDIGAERDFPFIAMELVIGQDLSKIKERLDLETILRVGEGVAGALDYIHTQDILHRDVKPQNIMVGSGRDEVKLMDFGIAKDSHRTSLTQFGMIVGSPLYMAPESIEGKPTARSDQYALAVILYELLTMRHPIEGALETLFAAKRYQDPRPAGDYAPWIPAKTQAVLKRGLDKDQDARFDSCRDLVEAFRVSLGDIPAAQRAMAARRQEAAAVWEQARTDLSLLRAFTSRYPDWPRRGEVEIRILELEEDQRRSEVRERIARESFEEASKHRSIPMLDGFLKAFPDSALLPSAKELIVQLQRERVEAERLERERHAAIERAYREAMAAGRPETLQQFAAEYPESEFAAAALARAGEIRRENERREREREEKDRHEQHGEHAHRPDRAPVIPKGPRERLRDEPHRGNHKPGIPRRSNRLWN